MAIKYKSTKDLFNLSDSGFRKYKQRLLEQLSKHTTFTKSEFKYMPPRVRESLLKDCQPHMEMALKALRNFHYVEYIRANVEDPTDNGPEDYIVIRNRPKKQY